MNALVSTERAQILSFDESEVNLIKSTICKGATDSELKLFLYQAKATGLNPLARQVYAVKRWDSSQKKEIMAIQLSIDGFRVIAQRTGDYAGQSGPFWCGEDGIWKDVWLSDVPPVASKIGVWRSSFKEPCWGVARFNAYCQKNKEGKATSMWAKMGDVMIAKCAEALALRKAFPQDLSDLYTEEEEVAIKNSNEDAVVGAMLSMQSPDDMPLEEKKKLFNEADEVLEMVSDEMELQSWFDQYHAKLTKNISAARMKILNDKYNQVQQALLNKTMKEKI